MGEYARMFTSIWAPETLIRDKLFNAKKSLQPMQLEYLDMPHVFKPNKAGFEFIYGLNKCEELEIFNLKSVQIIIDSHIAYWNKLNYLFVGLPMAFNLLNFWYWSNIVLVNIENDPDSFETQDKICRVFLALVGFYLLFLEISAIAKRRFQYLNDMARLFNFITPLLIQ